VLLHVNGIGSPHSVVVDYPPNAYHCQNSLEITLEYPLQVRASVGPSVALLIMFDTEFLPRRGLQELS
jgi:hypothetical protein